MLCYRTVTIFSKRFYHQLSKRPSQIITATVILTLLLFLPQIWMTAQAYNNFNSIIQHEVRLQNLSDKITHLDEVLTMSARMNAATGNNFWEQRYNQFVPTLDAVIKESIKLAPDAYNSEDAKKTDAANRRLVEMESLSFELVRDGKQQAAQELLSSPEYELEKQKYADGVAKRNLAIAKQIHHKVIAYKQQLFGSSFLAIISLIILIPSWLLVLRILQEYLQARNISQLALEETNQKLEVIVQTRTQELVTKNTQLQTTLEKLQSTQLQLIQTEKMSSLGQMVAGIAHEINNPINFICGNLDYAIVYITDLLELVHLYQQHYPQNIPEIVEHIEKIELEFLEEDIVKLLNSMKAGTERISNIVLSLRNFSRLDESRLKKIDIHTGIDSSLLMLQHRCQGDKLFSKISVVKEYGELPLIECYPSQLNQVFMSILANAFDALEDASKDSNFELPTIRIQTQMAHEERVIIRIIDNGCGISETDKSRVFDPFFTTKEVGKGTGLGLSISYQIIVKKHRGKLSCQSSPGKGTEFIIEIPIHQSSQHTSQA